MSFHFLHQNTPLTVGIEWEFLVEGAKGKEPGKSHKTLAEGLRDTTSLPLAILCWHTPQERCPACNNNAVDRLEVVLQFSQYSLSLISPSRATTHFGGYGDGFHTMDPLRYFHIKDEDLATHIAGSQKTWQPVEITSPVLSTTEVSAGLPQIQELMGGLQRIEQAVAINHDCGLHVHMGYASGMTLLRAKRVVSLILALEPTLLQPLVSPLRRADAPGTWLTTDSHLWPRSWGTGIALPGLATPTPVPMNAEFATNIGLSRELVEQCWRGCGRPGLFSALGRTWSCETMYELEQLLMRRAGGRSQAALRLRCGSNLAQLEGTTPSPSTIEFRHLQMTFDPILMHNWILILSAMVKAGLEDTKTFSQFFRGILSTLDEAKQTLGGKTWVLLLSKLGLDEQVPFWLDLVDRGYGAASFVGTENGILAKEK